MMSRAEKLALAVVGIPATVFALHGIFALFGVVEGLGLLAFFALVIMLVELRS